MFFRPNFCANCGEKIERVDWGLLTSRRFCQVCESEYKGQDLIPRVIVGLGILIGIFGIGSYLKSVPQRNTPFLTRRAMRANEQREAPSNVQVPQALNTAPSQSPGVQNSFPSPRSLPPMAGSQPDARATAPEDALYMCGAETKKGTPCTRRVRGNVRCYQHKGMPAMLSPDKLRIE